MSFQKEGRDRRGFLQRVLAFAGLSAAAPQSAVAQTSSVRPSADSFLPRYARVQNYQALKQSSHDPTGGNKDFWNVGVGETKEIFNSAQPGAITHIWFTISAQGPMHLKELVLRAYWDGNAKPSVETPIGDFFGLNLGQYQIYESAYLACSPGKSLNSYFVMPYKKSARLTVTNEGTRPVGAFYSNIDYQNAAVPDDSLYFHAQYRQATPNVPTTGEDTKLNPTGKLNYVYGETRGRGHLMGVTVGVQINAEGWMGEGDDMIFVDDDSKPVIIGTGMEDYFLGSWNFGGRDGAVPFAHRMYGAPIIIMPERTGGRYCLYRWHGDNPVTFSRYLKHTNEHGHANDRADNYYSVCYWYQTQPFTDFPAMPPVETRIPKLHLS
jgi:hypothetical protein